MSEISALIFGIFIIGGLLFGGYYITALLFLWPRLVAKHVYLTKEHNDYKKYQRTRNTVFCAQLVLMLLGFGLSRIYSAELFSTLLIGAAIAGGGFFVLQVVVSDLLCPLMFGMPLIGPPPQSLVRELSSVWQMAGKILVVPIASVIFFLFIASNFVGIVFLLVGGIIAITLRRHTPKNEIFKDKFDHFVKELAGGRDEFILAAYALKDIGTPEAIGALNQHLRERPQIFFVHGVGAKVLENIGDDVTVDILSRISKGQPGISESQYWEAQNLMQDIKKRLERAKRKD
jgi:hypothetical protein